MTHSEIEKEFLDEVIEDQIKAKKKKKGIQSKAKGNRGELGLRDILNERFDGKAVFSRTLMSGAYVGGANRQKRGFLTEAQKEMMTSDIFCNNPGFLFSVEHKNYSKDKAVIWEMFNDGSDLHSWMEQARRDAESIGKKPLLVVKYDNHKRIAYVPLAYVSEYFIHHMKGKKLLPVYIHRDSACYWLEDLLSLPDDFFFKEG